MLNCDCSTLCSHSFWISQFSVTLYKKNYPSWYSDMAVPCWPFKIIVVNVELVTIKRVTWYRAPFEPVELYPVTQSDYARCLWRWRDLVLTALLLCRSFIFFSSIIEDCMKDFDNHTLFKVKCTLVQALRLCTGRTAHRGSRGIALL